MKERVSAERARPRVVKQLPGKHVQPIRQRSSLGCHDGCSCEGMFMVKCPYLKYELKMPPNEVLLTQQGLLALPVVVEG
jgi:hypothetical protein